MNAWATNGKNCRPQQDVRSIKKNRCIHNGNDTWIENISVTTKLEWHKKGG